MPDQKKPENTHSKSWFLSRLEHLIEQDPSHLLVQEMCATDTQRTRTREKFYQQVNAIAAFLISLGIGPQNHIIFDIETGMNWKVLATWCACQKIGACAIFFPPDMRYRDVKTEIDAADAHNGQPSLSIVGTPERVKKWITTEADAPCPRKIIYLSNVCRDGNLIDTLFEWPLPENIHSIEKAANHPIDPSFNATSVADDAPAAYVFTQGSHQNARRVPLSYGHLKAQAEDLIQTLQLLPESRVTIDLTSALATSLFIFAASLHRGATFVCRHSDIDMPTVIQHADITHAFLLPHELENLAQTISHPQTGSPLTAKWRKFCLTGGKFRTRNTRKSLTWTHKIIDSICTQPIVENALPSIQALISYGNHFEAKQGELFSFLNIPVYNAFTSSEFGIIHMHRFMGKGGFLRSIEPQIHNGVLSIKQKDTDDYMCTDDLVFEDERCGLCSRRNVVYTTATGETVNTSPMREILMRHRIIQEVFLFGEQKPFITALLYLDPEALQSWCASQKLPSEDFEQMAQHPQVYRHIKTLVDTCNQRRGPLESVQKFAIIHRPLAKDPRILTPCKLTRPSDVEQRYATLLQSLYSDNY